MNVNINVRFNSPEPKHLVLKMHMRIVAMLTTKLAKKLRYRPSLKFKKVKLN